MSCSGLQKKQLTYLFVLSLGSLCEDLECYFFQPDFDFNVAAVTKEFLRIKSFM